MADPKFMRRAIELAREGIRDGRGGPFGAVVVGDGKIIGSGQNRVLSDNDPTAHAEIIAIRQACREMASFHLNGCEIYTSCEPCPMCLGAICWAHLERIHYAGSRSDAAAIGFDDEEFYRELTRPIPDRQVPMCQLLRDEVLEVFAAWQAKPDRQLY